MNFDILRSTEVLSATPPTLRAMVGSLSSEWIRSEVEDATEVQDRKWHVYDVVGHLIHAEETDWIPRARIILAQGDDPTFEPFDRFAMFENSKGKSLRQLLDDFEKRREESLDTLRSWDLSEAQLDLEANHPELGKVTLRHLLATWVVHDLTHLRQIVTIMAKRYTEDVGVWKEYLSILKS